MRSLVGLIILVALGGGIGALLWSRRSRDEIHSIDSYRNALDTLQEMRGPTASASVRVLDPNEQEQLRQPSAPEPFFRSTIEPPPSAVGPPPGGADGMVFREDIGRSGANDDHDGPDDHRHRAHDTPAWAMARMEPRHPVQNRQLIVVLAAGLVLALLVIVGILMGGSGSTSTTTTRAAPERSTTTAAPRSTTTSLPKPAKYEPTSSTATTASYEVPSGQASVKVTATGGSVWTIVTRSGGGGQLFAGAIDPGAPQSFKVDAGIEVNLGAPGYATLSVDGAPVSFPAGYQSPLVLSFAPAPPPTTTTAPPATTTTAPAPTTTTTSRIP